MPREVVCSAELGPFTEHGNRPTVQDVTSFELQQAPSEPLSSVEPSSIERSATDAAPLSVRSVLHVLFFICCWYCISITITLYNKWLFSVYGLHFPLLVTSIHIALKIPASRLLMYALGMAPVRFDSWRIILLEVAPSGLAMTGDIALSNLSFLFTTVTYYTICKSSVPLWIMAFSAMYGLLRVRSDLIVVLVFIAGGISLASLDTLDDVGGGAAAPTNASPAFELNATGEGPHHASVGDARRMLTHAGLVFSRGSPRWHRHLSEWAMEALANTTHAGSGVTGGAWADANLSSATPSSSPPSELDSAAGSRASSNDLLGAALVLTASMCAGFRWACTQVLMSPRRQADLSRTHMLSQAPPPLLNPVTLLYYTSPFGLAGLLPLALAREATPLGTYLSTSAETPTVAALVLFGACLGFALLLTELRVVQLASGLTLSVAGIFKEVLTVIASAWFLGDRLTPTNVAGLLICLLGIGLYNRSRLLELREQAPVQIDR